MLTITFGKKEWALSPNSRANFKRICNSLFSLEKVWAPNCELSSKKMRNAKSLFEMAWPFLSSNLITYNTRMYVKKQHWNIKSLNSYSEWTEPTIFLFLSSLYDHVHMHIHTSGVRMDNFYSFIFILSHWFVVVCTWGRCYNTIFGINIGVFLKNHCYY
jgi:hypothetical protein